MTLLRTSPGPNPLLGFQLDPADVTFVGHGLQRPECILAEADGTLWSADARGGVMRIDPSGQQQLLAPFGHQDLAAKAPGAGLLEGSLPNGLAIMRSGDFVIANFGTDRLEAMTRRGETRVLLDSLDGKPLGKVNFVLCDSRDRIWFTVSTMVNPWSDAVNSTLADGYVGLIDERGARIVADGFHFTNEIRLDASERWLHVAETTARRVTRLRVEDDGSLTDRHVHGPADLGRGAVDGIAFDAYGNLWATMIYADRLVAITPAGDLLEIFSDGENEALAKFEQAFAAGRPVPFDLHLACGGKLCPWMASVTFGGADLSTVYLGSLRGTTIPSFRSPVPGLPMSHWR